VANVIDPSYLHATKQEYIETRVNGVILRLHKDGRVTWASAWCEKSYGHWEPATPSTIAWDVVN
jgi:hypothetical protein